MFKISLATSLSLLSVAIALNLASFSGAQTKIATPSPKVHAGQELFVPKCMQCHALIAGQYSFGPNLEGEMKKPRQKTAAEVRIIIKKGKGKMPGFADKLTRTEIDDLLAYIRTL